MTTEPSPMASRMMVIYASQTGNAEHIAKNIDVQARERGFPSSCHVMDDFEQADFLKERVVVFVSSTTGDGDSPDNALKFWRLFRKQAKVMEKDALKHMQITVLGLGDTNYSNFGAHPKKIEKKLTEFGATSFYKTAVADEVESLEATVDPWIAGLWAKLEQIVERSGNVAVVDDKSTVDVGEISKKFSEADIKDSKAPGNLSVDYPVMKNVPLPHAALSDIKEVSGISKLPAQLCRAEVSLPTNPSDTKVTSWSEYVSKFKSSERRPATDYHRYSPFVAKITGAQCLTAEDAVKRCLFLEMDISGMDWNYKAGDSVGIFCPNNDDMVTALLQRLNVDPLSKVDIGPVDETSQSSVPEHLPKTSSAFDLIKYHIDITSLPRKAFFRMLAETCSNADDQKMLIFLCSRQGMAEFRKFNEYAPNVVDVLSMFPSALPSVSRLLDVLVPIAPRYYSICSASNGQHGNKIRFAFNIVDFEVVNPVNFRRFGLCTPWLDRLTGQISFSQSANGMTQVQDIVEVPIFPNPSHSFHLPDDVSVPIIMIGPGTGVAPYLGFCEERKRQLANSPSADKGKAILFTGFRHKKRDYLFQRDLEQYEKDGVIDQIQVSFSRDTHNGGVKYVQDLLRLQKEDIVDLMCHRNAIMYVCGDAKGMAKDVHETLITIVSAVNACDIDEAKRSVMSWTAEKRYRLDIWA